MHEFSWRAKENSCIPHASWLQYKPMTQEALLRGNLKKELLETSSFEGALHLIRYHIFEAEAKRSNISARPHYFYKIFDFIYS